MGRGGGQGRRILGNSTETQRQVETCANSVWSIRQHSTVKQGENSTFSKTNNHRALVLSELPSGWTLPNPVDSATTEVIQATQQPDITRH